MKLNEDKTELLVMGKPSILKEFNLDVSLRRSVKVTVGKVLV
jgi:hypothetical protein